MTEFNLDKHPTVESDDEIQSVPVVDVGALVRRDAGEEDTSAIQQIASASREWGFFQVINHGVPQALLDEIWMHARAFFAQPQAAKISLLRTRDNPWGYYHNELTKNQRDKKEVFDFTHEGTDEIYGGENRWPEAPQAFRRTMLAYYDACTRLSLSLLEAFCLGLGLPGDALHAHFAGNHTGFVRLNYYPVADPLADAPIPHLPAADMGVHHHSDAGALTLLVQDEVGGLQVHKDGAWHNVAPQPGAFVVNTGDMMQVWSNDRYVAAIHRVQAMKSRDRYSVPFFFNPSAATRVTPLAAIVGADGACHYDPIHWASFRGKRTDGDYADYGAEVQISHYRRD